jgi:hypothetical protein
VKTRFKALRFTATGIGEVICVSHNVGYISRETGTQSSIITTQWGNMYTMDVTFGHESERQLDWLEKVADQNHIPNCRVETEFEVPRL